MKTMCRNVYDAVCIQVGLTYYIVVIILSCSIDRMYTREWHLSLQNCIAVISVFFFAFLMVNNITNFLSAFIPETSTNFIPLPCLSQSNLSSLYSITNINLESHFPLISSKLFKSAFYLFFSFVIDFCSKTLSTENISTQQAHTLLPYHKARKMKMLQLTNTKHRNK